MLSDKKKYLYLAQVIPYFHVRNDISTPSISSLCNSYQRLSYSPEKWKYVSELIKPWSMKNILIRGPEYEHERARTRRWRFSHGNPIAVHSDLFNGPWPENNVRPDRVPLNQGNADGESWIEHFLEPSPPLLTLWTPFESNSTRG